MEARPCTRSTFPLLERRTAGRRPQRTPAARCAWPGVRSVTPKAHDSHWHLSGSVHTDAHWARERPSARAGIGLRADEPPKRRAAAIRCLAPTQHWCTRAASKQPPQSANGAGDFLPRRSAFSLRRVISILRRPRPAPAARCEPGRAERRSALSRRARSRAACTPVGPCPPESDDP